MRKIPIHVWRHFVIHIQLYLQKSNGGSHSYYEFLALIIDKWCMVAIYLGMIVYIFTYIFCNYQKSYLTSDNFLFLILAFSSLNYNENEYRSHTLA